MINLDVKERFIGFENLHPLCREHAGSVNFMKERLSLFSCYSDTPTQIRMMEKIRILLSGWEKFQLKEEKQHVKMMAMLRASGWSSGDE